MDVKTMVTGFPRIGENRELKKALESYWNGKISANELQKNGRELRRKHWIIQKNKGIGLISCNDFSMYDNMLDTAVMLNAIPERFRNIQDCTEKYFAMAQGNPSAEAMQMTKWFNTNYHYIVPELNKEMEFSLNSSKIFSEYNEAVELGINPKINIIGPLTFLGLSKTTDGTTSFLLYDKIISVYKELIEELSQLESPVYLQIEEPLFVKEPTDKQLDLFKAVYNFLPTISKKVKIIVSTYFGHSNEASEILGKTPVWAVGLDFIYGRENFSALKCLRNKKLVAGVVDGRNIWKNDIHKSIKLLNKIAEQVNRDQIIISSSCSFLHIPYSLKNEPDSRVKQWLSFTYEKLDEIRLLAELFHSDRNMPIYNYYMELLLRGFFFKRPFIGYNIPESDIALMEQAAQAVEDRKNSISPVNKNIQKKLASAEYSERPEKFSKRVEVQNKALNLPVLPTTTIGSFPQTKELRLLRKNFRSGVISEETYEAGIKNYITECINIQEELGLDVLVHGEPERNDMVEYFGEMLTGFHFTQNGWVQSYGSRCVKPPVIYGDVSREKPMTVKWIKYAQNLTEKPVKGMLTGPVTILNWSFVRDDKPHAEVSKQIALALSEEIKDLQEAGIRIIQVDEAAFNEGYPLRKNRIPEYEKWAVESFKFAVSTAKPVTQIHTHMCYSDFKDIIRTIELMDADVITIETARSGNAILGVFKKAGYSNEIGPGVYDIHSARIPSVAEFARQISLRLEAFPVEQLWVNPDCGLKTRKWAEVKPALYNMVQAVKMIRKSGKD